MRSRIGIALFLIAGIAPAVAGASPELLNKTIQVRYTTAVPVHRDNGENFVAVSNKISTIYISSAGQAFSRIVDVDGPPQNQATKERGLGENMVRLQGRKLVQDRPLPSGDIHMEVNVDPPASIATFAIGREGGRALRWKGVSGMWATATGPMTVPTLHAASRPATASRNSSEQDEQTNGAVSVVLAPNRCDP